MIPLWLAAAASWASLVVGISYGIRAGMRRERALRLDAMEQAYARGIAVGADGLANEYLAAAARAPDPFDVWPRPTGQVRRPS